MFTQPYALPGDSLIPTPGYYIIDREAKTSTPIVLPVKMSSVNANGSTRDSTWSEQSDKLWMSGIARASKAAYLVEVDVKTAQGRVIAKDTGKTFVEVSSPQDPESWYVTKTGDAVWWSERDGYGHLYLMGPDGAVKKQLTSGPWQVGAVQYVDEVARTVYFTARGRETKELVYNTHLYRVGMDGTGLVNLTPEEGNHAISMSSNGKWVGDAYSLIGTPAVSLLRDATTGRVIRPLEKADVSQLSAIGWKPAVPFTTKARDGVTDIHGVMYLPTRIDSTKKYPIISHIYPGPQVGSVGQWTFKSGGEPFALAELGFRIGDRFRL
jgi:dipeptidyl aminopeptidase/acylaminoacyl peptidase